MKFLCVQPGADTSTADVFNGYTKAMRTAGHEVYPVLLNKRLESFGKWLDWQWRRAGKPDPRPTMADVLYLASVGVIERALWTLPDWVVVFSGSLVHPTVFQMLKRVGAPTMLLLTETPYLPDNEIAMLPYATVAFTNERVAVDRFREINPHTYYLPHAYDPDIHRSSPDIPADVPSHDVVFVGTGFEERIKLLSAVDWAGVDFGLYGMFDLLGSRARLRRYLRGKTVPNVRTVQMYQRATIGLNLFRTSMGYQRHAQHITAAECLNPRAYELAACGVFQICEDRPEVHEVFSTTVPTFRTPGELTECVRYWLDPGRVHWRREYADAARQYVRGETFDARLDYVLDKLDRVAQSDGLRIISRDGINPTAATTAS